MLTEKEFSFLREKYEKLMYKISRRISGDKAIASIDDNMQDLWIALMEAVGGFEKQNNGANGSIEEFINTEGFNKYLKTCLWHTKSSKGKAITKKAPILENTVDVFEFHEALGLAEEQAPVAEFNLSHEQFKGKLTSDENAIVQAVLSDPNLIWESGKVNVTALSKTIGKPGHQIRKILAEMSVKLKNEF